LGTDVIIVERIARDHEIFGICLSEGFVEKFVEGFSCNLRRE